MVTRPLADPSNIARTFINVSWFSVTVTTRACIRVVKDGEGRYAEWPSGKIWRDPAVPPGDWTQLASLKSRWLFFIVTFATPIGPNLRQFESLCPCFSLFLSVCLSICFAFLPFSLDFLVLVFFGPVSSDL